MASSRNNISPINLRGGDGGVFFGDVWYEPGGECGPRIQQDFQMVIVHLGEAEVMVERQKHLIPPGSVGLFLPGRREHFRFSRKHRTHHTWCSLPVGLVPPSLRKRLNGLPQVQPQSEAFDLLMRAAFSLRGWRKPEGREMLRRLAFDLLEEYLRLTQAGTDEVLRESPCERARVYLEEHCGEEDCLRTAAQRAGVTPQHLIRLFRKQYQMTPGRYLWQARVEQGAGLLTATGLTVGEIADRCGFKNPFHFSRLLKRMQGQSPRELRQRAWARPALPGRGAGRTGTKR